MKINFKKILILTILLLSISHSYSQSYSCQNTGLTRDVKRLATLISRNIDEKSIVLADSLLAIFRERNLTSCEEALWTLNYKANGLEMKQELKEALANYSAILPIALDNEYWNLLTETYITIARVHEVANRKIDSRRNLDEAKLLADTYGLDSIRAILYSRSASYYRVFTSNSDTALYLANQAIKLGKIHKNLRAISDGCMISGMVAKEPAERLQYYIDGRNLNLTQGFYHLAIIFNGSISGTYVELGEIDKAEKIVRNTFEYVRLLTEENGVDGFYNIYGPLVTHTILAQIYEKRGIKDSVEYHQKQADSLSGLLMVEQDQNEISQQEIKNAVDLEKLKAKTITDRLRTSRIVTGIASFAFLVLAGLLYLLAKNRNELKSKNKMISEQIHELTQLTNKQGILLSEVHHRIKNNLQNVISLLTLQEQTIDDPIAKGKVQDVSHKIYSIALIHEQLYRDGDFEYIDIHQYFIDLLEHYKFINSGSDDTFLYEVDTQGIKLNLETVIPLGIICSEIISNSVKYGRASSGLNLKITTHKTNADTFRFEYGDNGLGYPESVLTNESSGMGMILLKSMVRQLNGKLNIRNNNGAVTELIFKQKEVSKI